MAASASRARPTIQIEGKLPFGYESMGEHTVKNIARPVRVYRLRLEPRPSLGPAPRARNAGQRLVTGVIGAVAIMVLLGAGGWAGWRWLRTPESAGPADLDRLLTAVHRAGMQ